MSDDDRFLSRWSRRKLAEKQREDLGLPDVGEEIEQAPEDLSALPDDDPVSAEARARGEMDPEVDPEAESERHPAEDIDIDSLTKESDFTIFMQKGVPAALKKKALRKLWTSDPVLANLDGLNDYEDMEWTYGLSDTATTDWKLGRGFLTDKELGLEDAIGDDPEAAIEESADGSDVSGEPESPDPEAVPSEDADEPAVADVAPEENEDIDSAEGLPVVELDNVKPV